MIHVVLYEPEIPQNTGNIMRTCMAFGCRLHLIEPLGFYLDESHLRRAGMDYVKELEYEVHSDWDSFLAAHGEGELFFLTRYGHQTPDAFDYAACARDIYLVFGKESTGIPLPLLRAHASRCIRLPMMAAARSLNLSNTVAIAVYEVLRQLDYPQISREEVIKGKDWLDRC